jgi:hypothetical protein
MAAGTTPIFPATVVLGFVQSTAANTARDGTGTIVDIFTGTTNGDRIDEVRSTWTVTSAAGMIRYYVKKSGGSYRLIHEEPVPVVTVSATQPAFECVWPCQLLLNNGDLLSVATEKAEAVNNWAIGGSF